MPERIYKSNGIQLQFNQKQDTSVYTVMLKIYHKLFKIVNGYQIQLSL